MKRTFIAISIPMDDAFQTFYRRVKNELANENIRWVAEENLHLTLAFIGDTDEKQIVTVSEGLIPIISQFPVFKLTLNGIGTFPRGSSPRVLWVGIEAPSILQNLYNQIHSFLTDAKFLVEKRDFHPHLTLGRIKAIADLPHFKNVFLENKNMEITQHKIHTINYMESLLFSNSPVYSILKKYPLIKEE